MGIPTATAALKTLRTNVVAGGLIPSPQIDGEFLGLSQEETEKLQEQIVREFALWADKPTCDAERVDNFYQLQQLAFLSYLMNGDTMALLPVKKMAGQPYDLRVRLIEGDRVCSPDGFDRLAPCTVQGHKVHHIVQGVETDRDGMVVAYWVCNRHPLGSHSAAEAEGITWARVEAYGASTGRRNVLHVMNRERVGQRRGVQSWRGAGEPEAAGAVHGGGDHRRRDLRHVHSVHQVGKPGGRAALRGDDPGRGADRRTGPHQH